MHSSLVRVKTLYIFKHFLLSLEINGKDNRLIQLQKQKKNMHIFCSLTCTSRYSSLTQTHPLLIFSSGTKPECTNRPTWMRRPSPSSAPRYVIQGWCCSYWVFSSTQTLTSHFRFSSQASLKKFLDYIQTGAVDKLAKVLDKGLDPNFHDPDSGGGFFLL